MESEKKVRISVVIKYVTDKHEAIPVEDLGRDKSFTLDQLATLLNSFSSKQDEEPKEKVVALLGNFKYANEILANALIDADREDLFDEKLDTIESVDDIIKQIQNL